jgi:cold shock CspA family protein
MSQPIDLQKLFMHQLQQQTVPPQLISPQQQGLTMQQELALQADKWQAAAAAAAAAVTNSVNGNVNSVLTAAAAPAAIPNPLLNGCATMVTNTNINVTYLNGAIGGAKYDLDKFKMHQGFIAVLKVSARAVSQKMNSHADKLPLQDNFGFIETLEHDQEVFFHFSNFIGNTNHLELGQEVEYSLSPSRSVNGNGGNCIPAENVRLLPRGALLKIINSSSSC